MSKKNYKTFLSCATERELINMPMSAIMAEVMEHYEDMQNEFDADYKGGGCQKLMEERMSHAIILFAEGKRLVKSQPESGRKLLLASIFWKHNRALPYLAEEERDVIIDFFKKRAEKRREDRKKLLGYLDEETKNREGARIAQLESYKSTEARE